MKHIELELKERFLIVEFPKDKFDKNFFNESSISEAWILLRYKKNVKLICKGSELTEEIAKGLVKNEISNYLVEWAYDYKNEEQLNLDTFSCLESFISAIEAQGYYWGENPLGKQPKITEERYKSEREFMDNNPEESVFGDHYADWSMWQEAESKTFNPEKILIFEIL